MVKRLFYLVEVYLLTVLIFVLAKVFFMAYNATGHSFSLGDVAAVIGHGMSLDLSMALYIVSLPFLCMAVSVWMLSVRPYRYILRAYYAVIAIAFALAFVADTSLYEFWLFKLDASCLQYLETPTEAMASVSMGYVAVRLLAVFLLATLFTWAYWRLPLALPVVRHRILASVGSLLLIPLIVIGIRGGLDESTTNIGQVYYSQNQFLNHSAVNPVFSFFASFEKTASNNTVYHFMDDRQCEQTIRELYNTQSIEIDTLLNTQTPNIIVVLLEGCGGEFMEIGGKSDVMPNLSRLTREGVYFTRCYGNTWRTDRGTVCAWSGYPSFPSMSVMKIPSKSRTMPNMAKTLKEQRQYHTHYLYGGDINFTNMRSYLIGGGFEQLTWKKDYTADEQKTSQWGVSDELTFKTLYQLATTMPSPYIIGYSTLSSHQPWDVPIRQFDDEVLNAFYYLDQCLGRFVQQFRKTKAWDNALLILLPDHGIPYQEIDESHPLLNHIPMVWLGGAVKQPRRIEQVCNQTDLPATLLGQLGINHDEYTFSRDVLSKTYDKPFAINTYTEGFSMYDSVSFVNYDFNSHRVVTSYGGHDSLLIHRAKAILQAASKDLDER